MKRTMLRKIAVLLIFIMILSDISSCFAFSYEMQTSAASDLIPDGYTAVYDEDDLSAIRDNLSGKYILMNDIVIDSGQEWMPIGSSLENSFSGVLNGNGYTIRGLTVHKTAKEETLIGLFGYQSGVIENLGLADGIFQLTVDADNIEAGIGSIAVINLGTIRNCYNANRIEVVVEGDASYGYAGGISCINKKTSLVENCYNMGSIFVSYDGDANPRSDVCGGGISADIHSGEINHCYNVGDVFQLDDSTWAPGGIVGDHVVDEKSKIIDCYSKELVKKDQNEYGIYLSDENLRKKESYVGFDFEQIWELNEENDYPYPTLKGFNSIHPKDNTVAFAGGNGMAYNPYKIRTAADLKNVEQYLGAHFILEQDIDLENEEWEPIGASKIRPFYGSFDGNGFAIKNANVFSESKGKKYLGFFGFSVGLIEELTLYDLSVNVKSTEENVNVGGLVGYVDSKGDINHCRIIQGQVTTENNNGTCFIGGIAGYNCGTLSNTSFEGKIDSSYSGVGQNVVGGIAGYNDLGSIDQIYSKAAIEGNIYSTASNTNYYAGLVGINEGRKRLNEIDGKVTNGFAAGNIEITNDIRSTARVCAGGLCGNNKKNSALENLYYCGEIGGDNVTEKSCTITDGYIDYVKNLYYLFRNPLDDSNDIETYITGLTPDQMTKEEMFTGFDFDTIWFIDETGEGGYLYPQLKNIPYENGKANDFPNSSMECCQVSTPKEVVYTGQPLYPEVVVTDGVYLLVEGVDYELQYNNNLNAGEGIILVIGRGSYAGVKSVSFNIQPIDISTMEVIIGEYDSSYNEMVKTPEVTIEGLVIGKDYRVRYGENILPGYGTVYIKGIGNYTGQIERNFVINMVQIPGISMKSYSGRYDGKPHCIEILGVPEGATVYYKTDFNGEYTTSEPELVDIGEYTVYFEVRKDHYYSSFGEGTVRILPESIETKDVELEYTSISYNGKARLPKVTIEGLKEGRDFTVKYSDNIYPGEAKVTIIGAGNYEGQCVSAFTIKAPVVSAPKKITVNLYGHDDLKATWSGHKVNGATVKYKVQYKVYGGEWKTLSSATTATSIKKKNLADGKKYCFKVTPYVIVNHKTYYGKAKTSSYVYTMKRVSGINLSKSDGKVKVKWTNIQGESGYQISKSTSKTKTKIVATYKTTSGTYKKVEAEKGKRYYYKVRAYKVVDGKKIYAPWSSVKTFKL